MQTRASKIHIYQGACECIRMRFALADLELFEVVPSIIPFRHNCY